MVCVGIRVRIYYPRGADYHHYHYHRAAADTHHQHRSAQPTTHSTLLATQQPDSLNLLYQLLPIPH